jgi:hypothetical protein
MAFDQKDWEARLEKAQTQEDFTALIMELPHGRPPEREKEPEEDGRELYLLEGRTPVRCYDERDVYFYVPIYDKIRKDFIRGIDIATLFVFMDQRYNGRTHWLGKDGPLLFATIFQPPVLSKGAKSLCILCGTYDEAEQMHQIAVKRLLTTPFEELANVYPNIHVFATIG